MWESHSFVTVPLSLSLGTSEPVYTAVNTNSKCSQVMHMNILALISMTPVLFTEGLIFVSNLCVTDIYNTVHKYTPHCIQTHTCTNTGNWVLWTILCTPALETSTVVHTSVHLPLNFLAYRIQGGILAAGHISYQRLLKLAFLNGWLNLALCAHSVPKDLPMTMNYCLLSQH